MDIVLVTPEIPHNTGCAARLAAATGARLHLVEPLGFSLEDRYLKRAGLDYWPMVDLRVHASFDALCAHLSGGERSRGSDPRRRGDGTATDPGRDANPCRIDATARPIERRLKLFTARGGRSLFETAFEADDVLVFGCETRGLPRDVLAIEGAARVYVPIRPGVRSLNLANVVCLGLYTAMDRAGVAMPANDGSYVAHPDARVDVRPSSRVQRVDA